MGAPRERALFRQVTDITVESAPRRSASPRGAPTERRGRAMLRRWSTASRLFAVLAVASGIAAFAIVRGYAARLEALRPVVGRPMPVVIAAADLTRGTSIGASMVRVAPLPSMLAPPGSFPDATELEGRVLLTDIAEGEAITRTRLAARSAGPVAALVEPGLRAAVVDSGLPPGAVRPGDRVDVLATYGGERPHTETVASDSRSSAVIAPSPAGAVGSGIGGPIPGPARVSPSTPNASPTRRRSRTSMCRSPHRRRSRAAQRRPGSMCRLHEHPSGHHPRHHPRTDRVRSGFELWSPDPRTVALRLEHRRGRGVQ